MITRQAGGLTAIQRERMKLMLANKATVKEMAMAFQVSEECIKAFMPKKAKKKAVAKDGDK